MKRQLLFPLTISIAAVSAVATPAPEQIEFFEKKVRPVLAEQCYKCHGPEKQKADLRVDSRDALLKPGSDGPAVVPGKPDESMLIKSIKHLGDMKMPEKAPPDLSRLLLSPMPGLLVKLHVAEGDAVEPGQPLATVEAMKMENILRAPRAGTVKAVSAAEGTTLAADAVILELE